VSGQSALVAPVNGLVSAQLVQQGQSVQPGQVVLTILPANSPLQAHLLVPSRAIGFVDHGDAVQVRYQAFPYQKFGHYQGKVLRVSRTALGNAELNSLGVAQPQEPMYRVVVELDQQFVKAYGKAEALRPGLLLEADILGDQRKLWEWLLEPLYSVSGKLE
jgi:membrane fusion protein